MVEAGIMSPHDDLLSANPSDPVDKKGFVAEVKYRCKSMISSRHYGHAGVLYGKAIEVLLADGHKEQFNEELAILYSNRSLTRSSTHNYSGAVSDANAAIECNESYSKAYWRLGKAYEGWEKYEDAVEAYAQGIKTLGGGDDKAWVNEVHKCRLKAKDAPQPRSRQPVTSSSSDSYKPNKGKKEDIEIVDESKLFTKSDAVRGYKIVDGKKTSYFHKELSEEEKQMIGDIAPKRIATTTPSSLPSTTKQETSAWNKAGTWEEKDFTSYAKELLTNSLLNVEYVISDLDAKTIHKELGRATAEVSKVKDVEGHASISNVRGKRLYVFEFSLFIEYKIILANPINDFDQVVTGSFKFPEIDGTSCSDDGADLEFVDFKITTCYDKMYRKLVEAFVRKAGLKDEVKKCICNWADTWHASL